MSGPVSLSLASKSRAWSAAHGALAAAGGRDVPALVARCAVAAAFPGRSPSAWDNLWRGAVEFAGAAVVRSGHFYSLTGLPASGFAPLEGVLSAVLSECNVRWDAAASGFDETLVCDEIVSAAECGFLGLPAPVADPEIPAVFAPVVEFAFARGVALRPGSPGAAAGA